MAERGYHGTSLRDIATAAGLRISSVYYHYPSKQDILLAVIRRTMDDLTTTVSHAVEAADEDPAAQLTAAIGAHILFHIDRRKEAFVTDSEIRSLDETSLAEVIGRRDEYDALFLRIMRAGRRSGAFTIGDETVTKNVLLTTMTSVADWYREEGRLSPTDIADEVAILFLRSFRAIDAPRRSR
jgi:AcrR family transcriptional regulator